MNKFFASIVFQLVAFSLAAQIAGFVDESVSENWVNPVGLTFDANGKMFVWEKAGKVFFVDNGQRQDLPVLDISEEVLNFGDHGLIGFTLDPNYLSNGFVYVLYVAKRHHVMYYGSSQYDPANKDDFKTTIGRVVRYQLNSIDGSLKADLQSRKILIGESISTGIPILVDNHGVNSLLFSPDGSLLISVGDASFLNVPPTDDSINPWFLEAISTGIITANQNIASYRSQSKQSLNGKILRIDASNGNGLPSNPFYTAANPRAAASRIWVLGLRNPYRFAIKPNSASLMSSDGKPGVLFIGDVGWIRREEINIAERGGENFGWPTYEGLTHINKEYSNPLYVAPNPVFPAVEWRGAFAQSLRGSEAYVVGSAEFKGEAFSGVASIGGVFADKTNFPSAYKDLYIQGDYEGWIKGFRFNDKNEATEVVHFVGDVHPTCFAVNPKDGAIYYINYFFPATQEVRKLSYDPNANLRPIAVASATPTYGYSPLMVAFKGSESVDPEGGALTYEWSFDNGETFASSNFEKTFDAGSNPITVAATLKVTDRGGKSSKKMTTVYLNNTPPTIHSTTIDGIESFDNNQDFSTRLNATITDKEHSKLSYSWQITLHHEDHSHFVGALYDLETNLVLPSVPCDGQKYYYSIALTATDPTGLSSTFEKNISPICSTIDTEEILSVYPNPTSGEFRVFDEDELESKHVKTQLFNLHGQRISTLEGRWKELKLEIVSTLRRQENAIYLLEIIDGQKKKTFKISKTN